MMTLTVMLGFVCLMAVTASMSCFTVVWSLLFSALRLMTMSSSWAQSFVTVRASSALIWGSVAPIGNQMTVPTLTSEPFSVYTARST